MRLLLLIAALLAGITTQMQANPLSGGCFIRSYSAAHLAKHPDQRVRVISLSTSALTPVPDEILFDVIVNLRGSQEYLHALASCVAVGKTLDCMVEGDHGDFILTARSPNELLMTLGEVGISFEGQSDFYTLSGKKGDDRSFRIPAAPGEMCN